MTMRLRYPELSPEPYKRLQELGHTLTVNTSLEPVLKALVELRTSQMNGCEFCIAAHRAELKKHHEPESRIEALAHFRDSDAFTPREKAALAWAESLTDAVHGDRASDEAYAAVNKFFSGKDLVDLSFVIAAMNSWNRLGIAFRPELQASR